MRLLTAVVAVAVVLAAGCATAPEPVQDTAPAAQTARPSPSPTLDTGNATDAGIFCERFIDQRTGGVEHGDYRNYETTDVGDGEWFVRGALADGTGWTCRVEFDGDETWTLADLTLRGR